MEKNHERRMAERAIPADIWDKAMTVVADKAFHRGEATRVIAEALAAERDEWRTLHDGAQRVVVDPNAALNIATKDCAALANEEARADG